MTLSLRYALVLIRKEETMKTVKEVSEITGVSIRTLRYYDEIGLLKPSQLTQAGYRLYDHASLEKLQQIIFLRELEMSLVDIKTLLEHPSTDMTYTLLHQKSLLENKRNHLNGIIELIVDVMKGDNKMDFTTFNDEDITRILNHLEENLSEESRDKLIDLYGSFEEYRALAFTNLKDEKVNAELMKWYGSKEKALEASITPVQNMTFYQKETDDVYKEIYNLKDTSDTKAQNKLVERLTICYKGMFHLDNARAMLLDLATQYLQNEILREANDKTYGAGSAIATASAIKYYYGVL